MRFLGYHVESYKLFIFTYHSYDRRRGRGAVLPASGHHQSRTEIAPIASIYLAGLGMRLVGAGGFMAR